MDEGVLADPRFPYLRTRPGKRRMQEIRDLLAERSGGSAGLGDSLAGVLAEAVGKQLSPEEAAEKVNAHATAEERAAFVGLDLDQLADSLRAAARAHPPLGTPRARGVAVAVQDALRTGENASRGVAVGLAGPGRRPGTSRRDAAVVGRANRHRRGRHLLVAASSTTPRWPPSTPRSWRRTKSS